MRVSIFAVAVCFSFLVGCGDGSSASGNGGSGGSGGGDGGSTSTTKSEGGSGGGGTTGSTTGSVTDTSETTTSSTTGSTTTTTGATDPCDSAGVDPVLFATEIQPIFNQSCGSATTCHLKAVPAEGLNLKAGASYASLVNVDAKQSCNGQKRVAPGDAAGSYLVNKITATKVCPMSTKMPPSGSLSNASKQKVIDWICQGAQNN